ncbi:MAG: leucine-rich repeat protein [Bacillota bacterium]
MIKSVNWDTWEQKVGGRFEIPSSFTYKGNDTCQVTRIDPNAFAGCPASSIYLGSFLNDVDGQYTFAGNTNVRSIEFEDGFDDILANMFKGCTSLKSIEFSEGTIGESAFQGCTSLRIVTFPSGIGFIGNSAFSGCTNLEAATFKGGRPFMGTGVFNGTNSNFTIYYHVSQSSSWSGYTAYSTQAYCYVTYYPNYDSKDPVKTKTNVDSSCLITARTDFTRTGYVFAGWYKEADCTNQWNFGSDAVTDDITLYAKWTTADNTAPTLTSVNISSSNSNATKAKTGDTITLSFTASESIGAPTVTIAGNSATVNNAGDSNDATWQANYTMQGTDTEGTVAFSTSFSDLAGNAGTAVSATTDSSSVTYDKTSPTLSNVTPTTLKASTAINVTDSETGTVYLVPTGTYTSQTELAAAATKTVSVATAGSAVTIDTTGVAEGCYQIYAADAAGNVSTASADITIDNTAPILSNVTPTMLKAGTTISAVSNETGTVYLVPKGTYTSQAELTAAVTKTVSVATAGSAITIDTAGVAEGLYQLYAVDAAGNVSSDSVDITIDNTAPTLNNVTPATLKAGTAINVTDSETGTVYLVPTGTYTSQTELAAAATKTVSVATAGSAVTIDTTGVAEGCYQIYAADAAGNVSTASADITIDNTAPTINSVSVPGDKTYKAGDNLEFTVKFSEAATVTTTGGMPYIPITIDTGGTVEAAYYSGSGSTALVFRYTVATGNLDGDGVAVSGEINLNGGTIMDAAGNSAVLTFTSPDTTGVKVDGVTPTLTSVKISSNNTDTTKAKTGDQITLNFTASEGIQTPTVTIAGNSATVNDAGDSDASTWQATYTMQGTETEGVVTFSISFSDLTDNAGTAVSATTDSSSVTYDKSAPMLTAYTPTGSNIKLNTTLTLTFSEAVTAGSGNITLYKTDGTLAESIAASKVSISEKTVTITPTTKLTAATGYYVLVDTTAFRDLTGNAYAGLSDIGTWSFTTVTSAVVITFSRPATGAKLNITTGSTVIVKLTDNGAGIDTGKVTIQIDSGAAVKPTSLVKTMDGYTLYYVITGINYGTTDYSHTIKVTAADSSGTTSSGSVTFTMEPKRNGFGFGRLRFD